MTLPLISRVVLSNEIAQSGGCLFFIRTLWALGALGATGMIL